MRQVVHSDIAFEAAIPPPFPLPRGERGNVGRFSFGLHIIVQEGEGWRLQQWRPHTLSSREKAG